MNKEDKAFFALVFNFAGVWLTFYACRLIDTKHPVAAAVVFVVVLVLAALDSYIKSLGPKGWKRK